MRDPYDRSSHWLLSHHGDSLLRLAGYGGFRCWRALAANVVQPRRLPDGLLEVFAEGREEPDYFLVEISTYPERRVEDQMLDDAMLVYLDKRVLPELLTIVLCERGSLQLSGSRTVESRLGWSRLQVAWRVVELWKVPASKLLETGDVGLLPWVPLTQIDGPVQPVLELCRDRIDQQAAPNERANLLAVSQVLMGLRYNDLNLLNLFGGKKAMIESPLLQDLFGEMLAERFQGNILEALASRFGEVPPEFASLLRPIQNESQLKELFSHALRCQDLDAFRSRLPS